MSATHDTHNWSLDDMERDLVKRREDECRKRGEALEAEAERRENIRQWLEWRRSLQS
jgi:hypothetical protein